ncbi:MAG: Rne/Rng family ribonuclease [Firmicutes bacterium]|nr:Rne/Rng family ribonuclease [Bacillota bacterium]
MKEMLVRIEGDSTAVAFLEQGQLAEIHLPRGEEEQLLGNIYLGRVENVLPGMQAAFVDIGLVKNCFLYVEDAYLPPTVYGGRLSAGPALRERRIHDLVRKGQQVIVQIFKEPTGAKGARVTMQPSLPGRYLVLLPCGDYIAVSRRIEDEQERDRLKELVRQYLPDNMGAIVRTVAQGSDGQDLAADIRQLTKEWRRIQGLAAKSAAPMLLHRDLEMLKRVIRDTGEDDIDRFIVNDAPAARRLQEVIDWIAPNLRNKPVIVTEAEDLFAAYDIYSQVEKALRRKVWLKSGGYIVLDQTEALNAIDVNTGKYVGECDLQETVLKTNLEAVGEIARQLRLRNLGGIVIVDFIDMERPEDKERLLEALEEELKKDRIRVTVMGMTQLGLVELTRKKVGRELSAVVEGECAACGGKGRVLLPQYRMETKTVDEEPQI